MSAGGPVAVHFGAGNIGRGFVGLLLQQSGYRVVFADVQTALVDDIAAAGCYTVHEVGDHAQSCLVEGVTALDSNRDAVALTAAIAGAGVVTTAVGPNVLRFIAPAIIAGLRERPADAAPLVVMACENAIGATDLLRGHLDALDPEAAARAIYANTAVDRIVPTQPAHAGLDVTVEHYLEWVIDRSKLGGAVPQIAGTLVVDDLAPYIERKLFTVNTGHAAIAYHGYRAGADTIADALERPEIASEVREVLAETRSALVAKHGLDPAEQAAYAEKIIARFANPELPDPVVRVGREPLRKLGRAERFIAPAAEVAEAGTEPVALLRAIGAALRFDAEADPQARELQELLDERSAAGIAATVMGIEPGHPLHEPLVATIAEAQRG